MNPPSELANRRYLLHELIGTGSVATVYRCTDTNLNIDRAAKLLPPALGTFFGHIERFKREATAMVALHHPHVVDVFDVGVDTGWAFIITEILHGGTLDVLVEQDGPVPPPRAVQFMEETLRALQAAHDHGVIHRDMRPNNVLLDKHGHAKLGDFGLARLHASEQEITGAGQAMGLVPWAAPEQLKDARTVDGRADLYGVGMTLASLLIGREPENRIDAVASTPEPFREVVEIATRADRDARYDSAREMRKRLVEAL